MEGIIDTLISRRLDANAAADDISAISIETWQGAGAAAARDSLKALLIRTEKVRDNLEVFLQATSTAQDGIGDVETLVLEAQSRADHYGFIIAEADMKMRGPGDMEGTQQSGLAFNLKLASLAADGQIIQLARDTADSLLESNPDLFDQTHDKCSAETSPSADLIVSPKEKAILKNELKIRFNNQSDWSRIS